MAYDSRGAPLKKGDHVLIEGVLVEDPFSDNGYCNCRVKVLSPEQMQSGADSKPPMEGDTLSAINTRMLTKVGLLLVALIGCLFAATPCQAQLFGRRSSGYYYPPQPQYRPAPAPKPALAKLDQLIDGAAGYNSDYIADMPTGTNRLYMTLVTSDDWQTDHGPRGKAQQTLVAWLQNDTRLKKYRDQSLWNWYTESDPHFTDARTLANGQASSLKASLGEAYPILAIENPDGGALFKMSALSLPGSAGELADWITSALKHQQVTSGMPGLTMPPDFRGKTQATPVRTEGGLHNFSQPYGGSPPSGPHYGAPHGGQDPAGSSSSDGAVTTPPGDAGQCGPDGCPWKPGPNDHDDVIDDTRPPSNTSEAVAAIVGLALLGGAGGAVYAARRVK